MKALTMTQPWASLYLTPRKQIETRGWPTRHRGLLAIHAAKGWTLADRKTACIAGYASDELPRGAVIGIVYLQDCIATEQCAFPLTRTGSEPPHRALSLGETKWGNFASGRYAWLRRESLFTFAPVPAKGALELWEWEWPGDFPYAAYSEWLKEVQI